MKNPAVPTLIIAGPTASGKTALAIELSHALERRTGQGGIIINMDSMQLYRELPVLTAQPTAAEQAAAPHRLYSMLGAAEACSVARYAEMAAQEIATVRQAGRVPILVGGTGLYLKVLVEGISSIPTVDPAVRDAARELQARIGSPALHALIASKDPAIGAKLKPNDTQRLIRAWEVWEGSGVPLSTWQQQAGRPVLPPGSWRALALLPPRQELYEKIDRRFALMVEEGAVEEVRALLQQKLPAAMPAMKATGVPELAGYIQGQTDLPAAVEAAAQSSRNYAKRQVTWFRNQLLKRQPGVTAYEQFGVAVDSAACLAGML